MANKKVTYTLELDAEISSLESKLKGAKSALDGVLKSSGAPAGLKKSLESLEDMLGRLRDKASTPLETVGDAGKVKKDITAVMQALNGLNRIIEDLHNISGDERFKLLPPDIVQKLTAAVSGIKTFEDSLKEATTETAALAKAREDLANATTGLAQKEADLQAKQGKLKENTDRRDQIKQEIAAIEERKKALEEAKKEQAKVDAFYSTPNADGTKKDRRQKYDGVSSTPAQAKKKTDNLAKQVAIDKGTLQNLSDELKIVNKDIESYSGQVATARRRADEAKTSLEGLNAKVESLNQAFQTDSAKKQQEAYDELRKTAAEAGLKMDDFSESFSPEEANKIVVALKKLKNDAMDGVTDGAKAATTAMDGFGDEAEELRRKTDAATESINEQNEALRETEAFENKIKQFLGLSGAAQVMRAALRDAMHTITELDATMTEMAVVTDLTVGDYWDQLPEYSQQASELGVSINSAYKAATLYYQQGLKGNEVTKISAETLKLAKIAGIDAADATNKMTAALRGFNMELNETSAQRVSDVYSELAAITAADVDEISNAMTKTASIAHSAGMEFETTAAFLSQIIETTRESAETAGTAMKTVIARFQELKKDPAEIGEVDGEIVDANKIETALRSVGVALRDSNGQFRDLDDVFLELSSKWDGLNKNTQRYIATIAAGSRQQSRFIAMMSDYGRTQELVTSANNSAGASNKQFEKTMDSLEAKMEKLKNAWHEFTMGIMESDLVKFGVDILTKFLEIVNKSTSAFNSFGGSLVKIVSIFGIFKLGSKIFEKIKQPLISFFADVVKMSREEGEKAGKAFDKGARKVATKNTEKNENQITDEELRNYNPTSFGDKVGNFIKDKTGVKEISSGWSAIYGEGSKEQGGLRDSQAKLAKLRQEGGDRKTRLSNLKTAQMIRDARAKNLGKDNSVTKQADKEVDEAKKSLLEYDKAQKKVFEESQKGWDQVSKGLTKMGETAMAAGVGISMLGGLLQSMGLEEIGEGVSEFGNIVTLAGTAVVTVIPIIKTLSSVLVAGGVSAQAAWWWAILIVAAVAALVVGIVAIAKAVKNSTPEAKLKKAEEAAKKASDAADQATDSYENLKDSLSGLDEQYKTLEKLTQGTKEWNEAILEINNNVLDLIEKYPQLAQFVKSENGVLTLDVDSVEVQNTLSEVRAQALLSKNIAALSDVNVSKAEDAVLRKNYKLKGNNIDSIAKSVASGELIIQDGAFRGGTKTIEDLGYTQEELDKVYKLNKEAIGSIREYGISLLETQEQARVAYSSISLSAQQMANTELFSPEEMAIIQNVFDEKNVAALYEKELSKISYINYKDDKNLSDAQKLERDRAIKETYGENVKLEDLSNEQIQAAIAQTKALPKMIDQIEYVPTMMANFTEKNSEETTKMVTHLLQDAEGSELSMSDYNHLVQLSTEELKQIYKDLGENAKDIFGTEKEFLDSIETTKKIVKSQNKAMATSMKMMFGDGATLPQWNIPPEIGSQLLLKFQEVFNKASPEEFQGFYDQFNMIIQGLTEEQQVLFASIVEATDWRDTTELATLPDRLQEAGLAIEEFSVDLYDFIETAAQASKAFAKLTAEELSKVLGSVSDIMQNINKGEQSRVFSEEQYKALLASDPTLSKEFVKMSNGYMYLGNSMDELREAILDNTSALIGESTASVEDKEKSLESISYVNNLMTDYVQKGQDYITKRNNYEVLEGEKEANEQKRAAAEADLNSFATQLYNFQVPFWSEIGGAFLMDIFGQDIVYNSALEAQAEANRYFSNLEQARNEYTAVENYERFSTYKSNLEEMGQEQLQAYFQELGGSLASENLDMSVFGIKGLHSNIDFSTIGLDTLKNWYRQINKLSDDEDYLTVTENNGNIDIGNAITAATLGGTSTLTDWYLGAGDFIDKSYSTYGEEDANAILKGSMFSLASRYDISNSILSDYLDENGKFITEKFDEFISLIAGYEEEERTRPAKDKTIDLINQVKDALIESRQKEIDELAERFDAIVEANNKMVDSLQELVNIDRQRRENEKTEQSISDKYNQLAYLSMDSSGNGALESLALQEEIKQAEQDYQDTLVDQAIQQLQDANQKAEEQRERQISLMQKQLDLWANSEQIWGEVNAIIVNTQSVMESGTSYGNTELAELLSGIGGNLSEEEKGDFARDIVRLLQGYTEYHTGPQYATGGLADFTGPAWLDGTKSRPEYVLNADQTGRFFALVDVLEGFNDKSSENKSGDNYFNIQIDVEKLENDYDVEEMANKIRRMIADDAMYRNVNSINLIR